MTAAACPPTLSRSPTCITVPTPIPCLTAPTHGVCRPRWAKSAVSRLGRLKAGSRRAPAAPCTLYQTHTQVGGWVGWGPPPAHVHVHLVLRLPACIRARLCVNVCVLACPASHPALCPSYLKSSTHSPQGRPAPSASCQALLRLHLCHGPALGKCMIPLLRPSSAGTHCAIREDMHTHTHTQMHAYTEACIRSHLYALHAHKSGCLDCRSRKIARIPQVPRCKNSI